MIRQYTAVVLGPNIVGIDVRQDVGLLPPDEVNAILDLKDIFGIGVYS